MTSLNKPQLKAMGFLTEVTRTGEPVRLMNPEHGLSLLPDAKAYYELKASILRKTKEFWRAGRAGFAYTSYPKPGQEVDGIWVFPRLDQALEKRDEMLAEGWTVKLVSWD